MPFAFGLALQLLLVAGDRIPSVDTLSHLEVGRNLLAGQGYQRFGTPEAHFPPLAPVGLALLERVLGAEMAAVRVWNLGWAVALIVLLTWLTRQLSRDDDATVLAAWLAPLVPGVTVVALREGGGSELLAACCVLGAASAAIAAIDPRAVRTDRARRWLLATTGAGIGLALLARPETLLPSLAIVATVSWSVVRGRVHWTARSGRSPAVLLAALAVPALVLVGPYLVHQRSATGSWTLASKARDTSIEAWRAVAEGDRLARDRVLYAISPDGTSLGRETRPLPALAREDPAAWADIVAVNAATIGRALLVPTWDRGPQWPLVPALLLLAALHRVWAARRSPGTRLLLVVAACPVATSLAFFTMPRYLLLTVAVLVPFAAWGIAEWSRRLAPRRAGLVRAAVVISCVPSFLGAAAPLLPGAEMPERIEQRVAGEWVREHTPTEARIMTRSYHVQSYAERAVVAMPAADLDEIVAFARRHGVAYLVADEPTIRHRRPELYRALMRADRAPDGLELVRQFEVGDQRIRIFRLVPAPTTTTPLPPLPLGYAGD